MVKTKPSIGSKVIFGALIKSPWHHKDMFMIFEGTISGMPNKDYYEVDSYDWYKGTNVISMVHISYIHSFEWGGIMMLNPRRSKKVFKGIVI